MRTCEKCGKANQPTRKYCIRCGASLIKVEKPKEKAPLPVTPAPPVPEAAPTAPAPEPAPIAAEEEKVVKPSQVSRDRVRTADVGSKAKSEFEKAKEAFAKAETVGIDEPGGSGIVETRMLRASEVKELLEGPAMMAGGEDVPPPTMMAGSDPLPPEAAHLMPPVGPSSAQIEESILGSKSAYVDQVPEPEPEPEPVATPPGVATTVDPELSAEFSSTRYEMEDGVPVIEATTAAEAPPAEAAPPKPEPGDSGFAAVTKPPEAKPEPAAKPAPPEGDIDMVIACPDCGKVINVDLFDYPKDVYSKMGAARLKQARFFVVQGYPDNAMQAVRKARALYEKAEDKKGLKEVLKLVESLAKSG